MGWLPSKKVWWQDSKEDICGDNSRKKKAWRPKLRWLDCIENDLKSMSVEGWWEKAEDRCAWAIILKEAVVTL